MSKTVVGLFKSTVEAQNVKHELVNEGYAAESIRVVANEADGAYASGSASDTKTAASTGTGVMDSIKNFFHSFTGAEDSDREYYSQGVSRGGAVLMATVEDHRADELASLLKQHGASDVDEEKATGAVAASTPAYAATTSAAASGTAAIPIVEEELQIGKRQVQRGGVRVYSHVVETPVEEDVRLREEHVRVQRNAVNRPASEADFQAFKEGTVELTETAEEVVVGKQARVVEEVRVGKDVSERTETVRDTLRHTEVEVEDLAGEAMRKSATSTTK